MPGALRTVALRVETTSRMPRGHRLSLIGHSAIALAVVARNAPLMR
jgi:hypothetical protein